MCVGGTENAITAAFEEADNSDSIHLLDEADTLFLNREHLPLLVGVLTDERVPHPDGGLLGRPHLLHEPLEESRQLCPSPLYL